MLLTKRESSTPSDFKPQNSMPAIEDDYWQLYTRNSPMIPVEMQTKIANLRIGFAGCGSVGGAFIDGALRSGVRFFKLADTGDYELNNLNRQMVTQAEIGINKAAAYEKKVKSVNKLASVETFNEGVCVKNVDRFLENVDFVFDGVDVTTEEGIFNKLLLHEKACQRKIPVTSALDLGFSQWVKTFDYRKNVPALEGRLIEARKIKHPLKVLIGPICPVEELPLEITIELIRLLKEPESSACQLGSVCFLLAALVHPFLIHFIEKNSFPRLIQMDLLAPFLSEKEIDQRASLLRQQHQILKELLDKTP